MCTHLHHPNPSDDSHDRGAGRWKPAQTSQKRSRTPVARNPSYAPSILRHASATGAGCAAESSPSAASVVIRHRAPIPSLPWLHGPRSHPPHEISSRACALALHGPQKWRTTRLAPLCETLRSHARVYASDGKCWIVHWLTTTSGASARHVRRCLLEVATLCETRLQERTARLNQRDA